MNNLHRFASCWLAALALACAPACQQSHTRNRSSSESHFLACERDKDCAELGEAFECRQGACEPVQEPRRAARVPSEAAPEPEEPSGAGAGAAGAAAIDAGRTEPVEDPPSIPDPTTPEMTNPCSIDTPFDGDENCLPAPEAADGIQIHIGPDDYENAAELELWVLDPGEEVSECRSFETPNDRAIAYSDWHLTGRPGIQRALITLDSSEDDAGAPLGACANPNPLHADPFLLTWPSQEARAQVAPDDESGWPVAARSQGQVHLHTFNFTDRPILRELWLNLYFPE